MEALNVKSLWKVYPPRVEALRGIDLRIEKGDFFGLLGPNGAGKSTLIGIICGLINKNSGQVSVHGVDLDADPYHVRKMLGVVPQEFNFNIFETCLQIVMNQAGFYGIEHSVAKGKALELLGLLGLSDKLNVPAGRLSGGMKRRLMIARALVHNPEVLILDEPTAGVDITLRRSMWDFIEAQNKTGMTIILTTHYLEEAESLCKNIAIIDKGNIIENSSTSSLLHKLNRETYILYCEEVGDLPSLDFDLEKVDQKTLEVRLKKTQLLCDLMDTLKINGIVVRRVKNKVNRLEELFVNLVEGENA